MRRPILCRLGWHRHTYRGVKGVRNPGGDWLPSWTTVTRCVRCHKVVGLPEG